MLKLTYASCAQDAKLAGQICLTGLANLLPAVCVVSACNQGNQQNMYTENYAGVLSSCPSAAHMESVRLAQRFDSTIRTCS